MDTMNRGSRRFALVVTLSALGVATLVTGRYFTPVASGQSYPSLTCLPYNTNPCASCVDEEYQCLINLNGWSWGSCDIPIAIGCFQNSSQCGSKYDCDDPPNPLGGNQCGAVFDQCT